MLDPKRWDEVFAQLDREVREVGPDIDGGDYIRRQRNTYMTWAVKFVTKVNKSGILRNYARRNEEILAKVFESGDTTGPALTPLEVPWEQLGNAYTLCQWALGVVPKDFVKVLGSIPIQEEPLVAQIAFGIMTATPFLWTRRVREAAIDPKAKLPPFEITPHLFPYRMMYWTPEADLVYPGGKLRLLAMLVVAPPTGTLVNGERQGPTIVELGQEETDQTASGQRLVVNIGRLGKYGSKWPEERGKDIPVDTEGIWKMLAFAQSPFLMTERHRVARPGRREFKKAELDEPSDVHVVCLRTARYAEGSRYERAEGSESPDWQYRWLVRGHFRHQWYAKSQIHKLIWIAPYVKGPDDKPLRETVYAVVR